EALKTEVSIAQQRYLQVTVTSGGDRHLEVALLGDGDLRFERFTGGEPWIDDRRPLGNLPTRRDLFLGRGRELVKITRALSHPPAAWPSPRAPARKQVAPAPPPAC
ncbi:MAG: hypothetical protein J7M16_12700, partial [Anaerolineae bacterium]|nr:hypothetical protein [Anaerolineae bacterium]